MTGSSDIVGRLEPLLASLELQWNRLGAPIASRLRPGLSDAEMDGLTSPYGLVLPTELRVWWNWHDGAELAPGEDDNARSIGPGHYGFSSLREALGEYQSNAEIHPEPDEPPDELPYWRRTWLPFMVQGPQRLVIDCAPSEDDAIFGSPVYLVDHMWDRYEVARAVTLSQAVSMWVWLLGADLYRWDPSARRPHWAYDLAEFPEFARATKIV